MIGQNEVPTNPIDSTASADEINDDQDRDRRSDLAIDQLGTNNAADDAGQIKDDGAQQACSSGSPA